MSDISRRIAAIEESATLAVTNRAAELKAQGEPVIGFGAGEPDFPTPDYIVEAARLACLEPRFHRYSPSGGLPSLREAVAAKTARDSGLVVEPSQVVVTNGGKQAIYETCAVLLDPGDEVLLPAPYWVTYPEAIRLAGGVMVPVPADDRAGFRVTVDQLEAVRTPRTKMLVFVSPSNPTGVTYPLEEVKAIGEWAARHGIWVMTDEIYEHLVYGDARFSSLPVVAPEAAERCVVVNGVSKTYAMTGWRAGWLIAPRPVAKAAVNLQSHLSSNVANVVQAAALAAVSGGLDAVEVMRTAFDRRRRPMHRMLTAIAGADCVEPDAAFYAFPSFRSILGGKVRGRPVETSLDLAGVLLDEAKVAIVPGEAFGAPGYARLSFAMSDDDIVEGLGRVAEVLGE